MYDISLQKEIDCRASGPSNHSSQSVTSREVFAELLLQIETKPSGANSNVSICNIWSGF